MDADAFPDKAAGLHNHAHILKWDPLGLDKIRDHVMFGIGMDMFPHGEPSQGDEKVSNSQCQQRPRYMIGCEYRSIENDIRARAKLLAKRLKGKKSNHRIDRKLTHLNRIIQEADE